MNIYIFRIASTAAFSSSFILFWHNLANAAGEPKGAETARQAPSLPAWMRSPVKMFTQDSDPVFGGIQSFTK